MKRDEVTKVGITAFLMAVVAVGGMSIPDLPEHPPDAWVITFGLTCIAIGLLIGFGMREVLMPDDDE